jgi:hypothetical protein
MKGVFRGSSIVVDHHQEIAEIIVHYGWSQIRGCKADQKIQLYAAIFVSRNKGT